MGSFSELVDRLNNLQHPRIGQARRVGAALLNKRTRADSHRGETMYLNRKVEPSPLSGPLGYLMLMPMLQPTSIKAKGSTLAAPLSTTRFASRLCRPRPAS